VSVSMVEKNGWVDLLKDCQKKCRVASGDVIIIDKELELELECHRSSRCLMAHCLPSSLQFRFRRMRSQSKISENVFADWLSRLHWVEDCEVDAVANVSDAEHDKAVEEALRSVHNARSGHHRLRRTWLMLNEHYPGHAISQKAIREFLEVCPECQKYRISMRDSLPAPRRVLDSQHRHTCGYDLFYITPGDKEGFKYLHVIKLMPSRIVGLYRLKVLRWLCVSS
jgi:hypothetical protein